MRDHKIKTTPPRLRLAVDRRRLFDLIDRTGDCPVTWVCSPAGSGKTTLVASYVQSRGIPVLWYRIDEDDSDPATFFYYMREAARSLRKGRTRPLPLLSPELRPGISAFTRHYFSSLFGRMPRPCAIVFDNCQDVPVASEFHEIIANGLMLAPEGVRVFMVSREEPPAPYVSLRARSMLAGIGWDDVRFTLDESREMIGLRAHSPVPEEVVEKIHGSTRGWAAGVILMLDRRGVPSSAPDPADQGPVFDYLAIEVFRRFDESVQDFLLVTSLLSSISPGIASSLTGTQEGASILAHLDRNSFFTERYGAEYRYHPLFREFLLALAAKRYTPGELASLTVKAGRLLIGSGQAEEGIRLLLDAGAHAEAVPHILGHARTLLGLGRIATLEEWAQRLPGELRDSSPWLLYWLGMGHLVTDPAQTRDCLERAFALFEAQGDHAGRLLCVAGIMNSILLEWDDYTRFDKWIDWVDRNVDVSIPLPSPEMDAQIASAMVCSLTYRMPWHPNMAAWIERAVRAGEKVSDPVARLMARGNVMEYHAIFGNFIELHQVAEDLRKIAFSPNLPQMAHLTYMIRIVYLHDWMHGSWEETIRMVKNAITLADDIGAHFLQGVICLSGIVGAFELEDLELAGEFFRIMEHQGILAKRGMRGRFCSMRSIYHMQRGDLALARQDAENAVKEGMTIGSIIYETYARIKLTYILRYMGEQGKAAAELERIEEPFKAMGHIHLLYLVRLTQASIHFDNGKTQEARKILSEAFSIGKTKKYAFTFYSYWQPREMARLCAEALDAGIEAEYARELIKRHSLTPDFPRERLLNWPFPVRIRTLGRFEVLIDERPLSFTGKVQKRPLMLLKALICMGGRKVRQEEMEDMLWPDADGDAARISFKTTLSRLRRLLGDERAIEVREGRVSLNKDHVWLDTWALEDMAERVSKLWEIRHARDWNGEASGLMSSFAGLHGGEFLGHDDDPWIHPCRERLRRKSLKVEQMLSDMLGKEG